MRLTTPLDLPAPGRSQTLYLILRFQQSPVFLLNSRGTHFTATPRSLREYPFFRSYGIILPSSLAKSHSRALGFSPHLPVSVYGTGRFRAVHAGFLGSVVGRLRTGRPALAFRFRLNAPPDFSWKSTPTIFPRDIRHPVGLPFCVTS